MLFMIATQEIGDLMGTRDKPGPGWTIIQQAATKAFLLNENVSKVLQDSFGLSPEETDFIEKRIRDNRGTAYSSPKGSTTHSTTESRTKKWRGSRQSRATFRID